MRLVLELDLPWLSLCDELVDFEEDGSIHFPKFLERCGGVCAPEPAAITCCTPVSQQPRACV
jgi:hypothetical protein